MISLQALSRWVKRNRKVLSGILLILGYWNIDWGLSNIQWMAQINYVHPTPLGIVHGFWWFNLLGYLPIVLAFALAYMEE